MMCFIKRLYIGAIFLSILIAVVSVVICGFVTKAYAVEINEWRPSVEINKEFVVLNEQNNSYLQIINEKLAFIKDYENGCSELSSKIDEYQEIYNYYEECVNNRRSDIEQLTERAYAACYAKDLLDEVVGNKFVTDAVFHWFAIPFFVSSENEEIISLLENYYSSKKDLDEAVSKKNNADQKYEEAVQFIQAKDEQNELVKKRINELNVMRPQVLCIEEKNGAAGESRIEGDGFFCHPCPDSTIAALFGEEREGYIHKGIDFAIAQGSPIYVAADGVVIKTGEHDESAGLFVKIQHDNGFVTTYMHCSHIFVPDGVRVHKGDNIALVGNTGDSTGPHLHFQVELNDQALNGLDYMQKM